MDKQHPSSGKGSGKRGRPPVGKPEQVRLSEDEKALAISFGEGVLAKGIRVALRVAEKTCNSHPMEGISPADAATLKELGLGDIKTGLEISLEVVRLLGVNTVRKMSSHGSGRSKNS